MLVASVLPAGDAWLSIVLAGEGVLVMTGVWKRQRRTRSEGCGSIVGGDVARDTASAWWW